MTDHPRVPGQGTIESPAAPVEAVPVATVPAATVPAELVRLRDEIEVVDRELIRLIAERVRLARCVGAVKRATGLPVLDPSREAAIVRRAAVLAREAGLRDDDVRSIFWHLIGLARRAQAEES